jgi:hypothetical protein
MVKVDNELNKVKETRQVIYKTIDDFIGEAKKEKLKVYRLKEDNYNNPYNLLYQDKKCSKPAVSVDIGILHINGRVPYQIWVHDEKYYNWAYKIAETLEKKLKVEFELIKA